MATQAATMPCIVTVERVIHALLKAEIAAKQARSINCQLGVAKLPLAKELAELSLEGNAHQWRADRAACDWRLPRRQRNVVLVGGTGTGKSHIAIGLARNIIKAGRKARFFNAVDLANKLEIEAKLDRQGSHDRRADAGQPRHHRRAWLSPLRTVGRPAAVPPHQPALRAHVYQITSVAPMACALL
jgi:IstB-like ATP binding protein